MKNITYIIYLYLGNEKITYAKFKDKESALYEYDILKSNGAKVELIQFKYGESIKLEG